MGSHRRHPRARTTPAIGSLGALVALALLLPTLGALAAAGVEAAPRRPNIVLIVTDDQDARSVERMPHVRALLRDEGTDFARFFAAVPACCPSRASILRGQYAHNHGVVRNSPPNGGFPAFHDLGHERSTVATWLDERGYRTGLFGKYLNEYPEGVGARYVPPGWDRWHGWVKSGQYVDYTLNENGRLVDYGGGPNDYQTDVLSRKARAFIEQSADAGAPFFAYIAPPAPHEPAIAAPRHEGRFDRHEAPRPPSFNEVDVGDKPDWVRRDSPPLTDRQVRQIDALYRQRLRSLLAVDDLVKDLVRTLEATGTLDATYVFFTSDNGFMLGEHRQAIGKGVPYEEAIRVPLIVRGPDVARRVEGRLALNTDLAPTFAALAGAEVPDFVDGRSLVPLLHRDRAVSWRRTLLVEYIGKDPPNLAGNGGIGAAYDGGVDWTPPHIPAFRVLRTQDVVYVEYANREEPELYDLRADPYQLRNLARSADPDDLERLSARLAELQDCEAAGCRTAEDRPLDQAAGARPMAEDGQPGG